MNFILQLGGEKGGNFQDYVEKKYGGTRYQPKLLMSLDKIQGMPDFLERVTLHRYFSYCSVLCLILTREVVSASFRSILLPRGITRWWRRKNKCRNCPSHVCVLFYDQFFAFSHLVVSGVPKPLKGKIKGGAIRNAKNHTRYSLVSRV